MAKKVKEETVTSSSELISDLISGSSFKFIGQEGEKGRGSLTDKPKVETPLIALDCLLGGGLPLGAILEVFGPNASGKSSFMYETLGNFQRQYPDGVAFIIDTETSTDDSRLRQLGVDPMRAPRMGAATLEDGFEQINKIIRKMIDDERYTGFPVMILWDTIASAPSRAQVKSGDMYGGGMAERARIIKASLMNIFPLIEKQNVLLVLLNQVMAEIGGWRPGLTSAGGHALKHDIHMRLQIDGGKTNYEGVYAVTKYSTLSVVKSKVSPLMGGFPITIDITKGGIIDRVESFVWWMTQLTSPAVFKQAAWWSIEDWCYNKYKPFWDKFDGIYPRFRQSKLYEIGRSDERFIELLKLIWLDLISERYVLQREVVKSVRDQIETKLMMDLKVNYEDFNLSPEEEAVVDTNVDISELSSILSETTTVDESTGEVIEN